MVQKSTLWHNAVLSQGLSLRAAADVRLLKSINFKSINFSGIVWHCMVPLQVMPGPWSVVVQQLGRIELTGERR